MSISAEPSVRVLIVSSQPIVRAGLAAVLRPFRTRVKVVGERHSRAEGALLVCATVTGRLAPRPAGHRRHCFPMPRHSP